MHTVRGGVSPTVRDRGKCSWPNVHSPAPPSPTACTERAEGGLYTYCKHAHSLTHPHGTAQTGANAQKDLNTHTVACMNALKHLTSGLQTHVCTVKVNTFANTHRQNTPGSWRSSARYQQQPPLAAEGPTEPQLLTLLSLERETGLKILRKSHISIIYTVYIIHQS